MNICCYVCPFKKLLVPCLRKHMIFFLFHFFFIENSASSTVRPIKRVTRLKCTGNYVRDEEMKDETRQIHNLRKKNY